MKPLLATLFLVGLFLVVPQSTFAAPIVAGSFSVTWDNSGGDGDSNDPVYINLDVCATAVYWEEVGNESNNGTTFNCVGEGNAETEVSFPSSGNYRIDYSGSFTQINISSINKGYFKTIEQWGDSTWTNLYGSFQNMTDLAINASDAPDLSSITNLGYLFAFATNFNSNINHWDVSTVTDMAGMFAGASSYNQPLDNWDVSNVTTFWGGEEGGMFEDATSFNQSLVSWDVSSATTLRNMFNGSGLSSENYSAVLNAWAALPSLQNNVTLGAQGIIYLDTAATARQSLIDTYSWTINDAGPYVEPGSQTFITRWDTSLDAGTPNDLILYLPGSASAFTVDWGDGTTQYYATGPDDYVTHTYSTPGIKTVTIQGNFPYFYAGCYEGDEYNKLIDVVQWGTGQWESFYASFGGCTYLEDFSATDVPDLSQVTDMSDAFSGATSFNGDLSDWDVSNVIDMTNMFAPAPSFNSDISRWDVSNVTGMQSMFNGASSFNQDISSWDVSPIDMYTMFNNASSFNQDISSWDVSGLTQNSYALRGTAFSTSNYTKLLLGWSTQVLPDEMYLEHIGGTYDADLDDYINLTPYCSLAQSARDIMTGTYNWSITDGGSVPCKTATYSAGTGGSLTGDSFQYIVDGEGGVAVTAVPGTGYRFARWSDGSTANPRTDSNLTADITVTAIFASNNGNTESTKVGVRAKQLAEALKTMPVVGSVAKFVSSVRDFLTYLTNNEDKLEQLNAEERTVIIVALRDVLAFLLRLVPGV